MDELIMSDIKHTGVYEFDVSYYILFQRYARRYRLKSDQLNSLNFTSLRSGMGSDLRSLEHVLSKNLERFFNCCLSVGIEQIYIGEHELVTLDVPPIGECSAIMYVVAATCNRYIETSCKNEHDNLCRISGLRGFIPDEYVGKAWDILNGTEICSEPFRKYMVEIEHGQH